MSRIYPVFVFLVVYHVKARYRVNKLDLFGIFICIYVLFESKVFV